MKKTLFICVLLTLIAVNTAFAATFVSGSTGKDGAFNPTTNTVVQLPETGILNYTTMNVPAGVTVTFQKNASNTPVYMLATGDVTIAGTISVNGANAVGAVPGQGGPGGYDGGFGGPLYVTGGMGLGPGAGSPGTRSTNGCYSSGGGGGAGFLGAGGSGSGDSGYSTGGAGGASYGNYLVLPMIGGSGGGGGAGTQNSGWQYPGGGGGGGGGAILIASSGTITITGSINAKGGNGANGAPDCGAPCCGGSGGGGGGSGGAIKLIANTIVGNGNVVVLSANGGAAGTVTENGGGGSAGIMRLEAYSTPSIVTTSPARATSGYPGTIFIAKAPILAITSIAGVNVPANPSGGYGAPDIILPGGTTNPVTVNISATNVPVGTQVTVNSAPEYGTSTSATGILAGTDASSSATVQLTLSTQYQSIISVTTTFAIQTTMYYQGEKIEKVRMASTIGKRSEVTYITESGREVKAQELLAAAVIKDPSSKK